MGFDGNWMAIEEIVADILDRRGVTPTKLGGEFTDSGHRVISAKLMKGGRLDLNADEPRFVEQHIYEKWMRTPLHRGDVLVTSEAPLGELAYMAEGADWCLGQRLFALRPNPDRVDGRFLFYALQTAEVRADINGRASGTTVLGIRQAELRKVQVPVPPLEQQTSVAEFLGAIDDRIDNLRQTNTTLEAIAQALFKSWFVDFDPVHAKAEGRARQDGERSGQPRKPQASDLPRPVAEAGAGAEGAPEAMDAATAALFPSEFEQSELGLIPKGWRAGILDDLSHLNVKSWSSKGHPDAVLYVDLSGVHENRIGTVKELPYSDAPSRARRSLRDGDTIVGTVRPGNRAFAYIHLPAANLTGSTGFAVLSPKDEVSAPFAYLAATRDDSIERLTNLADGGAYPAVRPNVVSATPVVIPPASIIAAFSRITAPMLHKIGESRNAEATLVELRDTLLPRLISGRLRLPEAMETAKEARE